MKNVFAGRLEKYYAAQHPDLSSQSPAAPMIRCHLSALMRRDKLRIADVARLTGLNRSTVTALCRNSATRIEIPAVDRLCSLFRCGVGELFEQVPDEQGSDA